MDIQIGVVHISKPLLIFIFRQFLISLIHFLDTRNSIFEQRISIFIFGYSTLILQVFRYPNTIQNIGN